MVLATAVEFDWDMLQLDVQTTVLNAKRKLYTKRSEAYEKKDQNTGVPLVARPHKSLYGLPQRPKNWHGTIDTHVMKIASIRSSPPPASTCTTRTTTASPTAQRTRAGSRRPSSPSTSTT